MNTYVNTAVRTAVLILTLTIAACSSTPKVPVETPRARATIDYDDLQNRLGLDLAPGETGFREKKFDACDLGEALHELKEPLSDCHQAYFTLIQYQLSCRSELQPGAVLTEADLTPVGNQHLKYTLNQHTGPTVTNHRGEGVIRLITRTSQKRTHLKISNGTDFMMVRANEVTAIVTPPEWCR
jgi:hypothetical protein